MRHVIYLSTDPGNVDKIHMELVLYLDYAGEYFSKDTWSKHHLILTPTTH
jgi:hypothetical protein